VAETQIYLTWLMQDTKQIQLGKLCHRNNLQRHLITSHHCLGTSQGHLNHKKLAIVSFIINFYVTYYLSKNVLKMLQNIRDQKDS
jgi:hypothetical protein